jgi:hypothetical protein
MRQTSSDPRQRKRQDDRLRSSTFVLMRTIIMIAMSFVFVITNKMMLD